MKTKDFLKALGFNSPSSPKSTGKQQTYNTVKPVGHLKHADSGLYVSPDGMTVTSEWYDKNTGELVYTELRFSNGIDGKPHVYRKSMQKCFDVELLVIETYKGKMPQDGKDYVIFHRDGDIKNNAVVNLEWKERSLAYPNTHKANTAPHVKVGRVMVFKNGRVKQELDELSHVTWNGDGDLDMIVPVNPHVRVSYRNRYGRGDEESLYLDDLMDKAGYIDGDKRHFKDPVVLHRDNNYENFASDNLEWVDRTDQRYQDYMKQVTADINKKGIELNGEKKWRSYTKNK